MDNMQKLKRILAITGKDFREAIRNRTILIVIILPLAASLLFTIVDSSQMQKQFKIGIVETGEQGLTGFISRQVKNFTVQRFENISVGKDAVESGVISALVVNEKSVDDNKLKPKFSAYINNQKPLTYLFLKDNLEEIIKKYLQVKPKFKMVAIPVNTPETGSSFLPIWITITITMIGVLVMSGNFAEEKDNKTLAAIIVSPASYLEILVAKGMFGILFATMTAVLMVLLNGITEIWGIKFLFLIFLVLGGSITFTIIGLLIGVVAKSQSAARALGTVIYFPLLFPTLIYDLSEFTRNIARLFPTFYLFKGLEKVFIYQNSAVDIWSDILILSCFSLVLLVITYYKFNVVIKDD